MIERVLEVIGLPPELGFGGLDLVLLGVAAASALWVHFSRDTHGFITVGYRVPFRELPRSAKAKVYFSLLCGLAFGARLFSLVA